MADEQSKKFVRVIPKTSTLCVAALGSLLMTFAAMPAAHPDNPPQNGDAAPPLSAVDAGADTVPAEGEAAEAAAPRAGVARIPPPLKLAPMAMVLYALEAVIPSLTRGLAFDATAPAAPTARDPMPTPATDPRDQIRNEIKARLPLFQACAEAAHRRGSAEVRRLQATWIINPDGTVRELRLDGLADEHLAKCIARGGKRALDTAPGVELTIPTPIVFVR